MGMDPLRSVFPSEFSVSYSFVPSGTSLSREQVVQQKCGRLPAQQPLHPRYFGMRLRTMPQAAEIIGDAVHFRTWASGHRTVDVVHLDSTGNIRGTTSLQPEPNGYFSGFAETAKAGDLYKYRLDGAGIFPDPSSRYQPQGVHGPSAVVDPLDFYWTDAMWSAPAQRDLVIYELHVGTFTRAGTFRSAIE